MLPGGSARSCSFKYIHLQAVKCDNTKDLHVPQVFRDWDGDLVEGVSRGRAVGIEGSDAIRRDDLIVRGVARRIFNHIELERA